MSALRPGATFAFAHPAHALAFGFGAGLAPVAPGTAGTLVAWPAAALLVAALPPASVLAVVAALFVLGIWCCGVTGRHLGVADHPGMVWDEMVAFLLILAIPVSSGVLWVDRRTAELERLTFQYEGLPDHMRRFGAEGEVRFQRLDNGIWIIPQWWVRSPLVGVRRRGSRAYRLLGWRIALIVLLLDAATPGRLGEILVDPQPHPAVWVSATVHLATGAVIAAAIS